MPGMLPRMFTTAALAALLLSASSAPASEPAACTPDAPGTFSTADAESYIRKAERDWAASISVNEAMFLKRVAASDFTAVFDGKVIPRAVLIARAETSQPGASTDRLTTLQIHVFGSVAIAEGDEIWSVKASGPSQRIVWMDAWVHCGEWRLKTSVAVGD